MKSYFKPNAQAGFVDTTVTVLVVVLIVAVGAAAYFVGKSRTNTRSSSGTTTSSSPTNTSTTLKDYDVGFGGMTLKVPEDWSADREATADGPIIIFKVTDPGQDTSSPNYQLGHTTLSLVYARGDRPKCVDCTVDRVEQLELKIFDQPKKVNLVTYHKDGHFHLALADGDIKVDGKTFVPGVAPYADSTSFTLDAVRSDADNSADAFLSQPNIVIAKQMMQSLSISP